MSTKPGWNQAPNAVHQTRQTVPGMTLWKKRRTKTAWYQQCDQCDRLLLVRRFFMPSGATRHLAKCVSCWRYIDPDGDKMIELPFIKATNAPNFAPYPENEETTPLIAAAREQLLQRIQQSPSPQI